MRKGEQEETDGGGRTSLVEGTSREGGGRKRGKGARGRERRKVWRWKTRGEGNGMWKAGVGGKRM